MPLQIGKLDDRLKKSFVQSEPVEPIVPIEVIEKPPLGFMNWEERLRTTEEMLQRLSGGYPFAGHGDDQPLIEQRQP